jgi:uncharacterized membrane protein
MTLESPPVPPAAGPLAGQASRALGGLALIALAIGIAAGLARLVALDHLVVWHDEVFTLVRVFGYRQAEVQEAIFSGRLLEPGVLLSFQAPHPDLGWGATLNAFMEHPEHAPLYYALVKLATLAPLPLDPLVAARGVSALFGLLLIPAAYWLTRELFGGGAAPWVAALLVACSPLQLLYAQEARQYALWTLMVVASSAALGRALSEAPAGRRRPWWPYGVLVGLGLYTHLLFVVMLPLHGAYVFLARRGRDLGAELRPWIIAVGAALAAFGPWLWVVLAGHEQTRHHTEWMARPIGVDRLLQEWANHLTRLFVDLDPDGSGWWALLLIPVAWGLARFLHRAPRPGAWLLLGIMVGYGALVLGPDLLLGGSRSQHVRYALPAVLAVQLMVAWVIGAQLDSGSPRVRALAAGALAFVILLGGLSILAIQRADTWWTKGFSAANGELARRLNRGERPLVLASDSGVGTGELISLAYRLDPRVRLWGERGDAPPPLDGFEPLVALMPSPRLQGWLKPGHHLEPALGTWQWFQVAPASTPPNPGQGAPGRSQSQDPGAPAATGGRM